jgi:murein DD-endopeptidase MepM/ murein hydrolase activator NlpD
MVKAAPVSVIVAAFVASAAIAGSALLAQESVRRGYDITETGLVPKYPAGYECPPITSLYASWIDVDGTRRSERHSGIDAGRLGDRILAPGPGVVRAAWKADWGWGNEGALLIRHTAEELGLTDSSKIYYSEFDHLTYRDAHDLTEGESIERGEDLGQVSRPGGKHRYLPEVHWEVWEAENDILEWTTNKHGGRFWTNKSARLIDPLYMLGLHAPPDANGAVAIAPFQQGVDYSRFRGFTYILACRKK